MHYSNYIKCKATPVEEVIPPEMMRRVAKPAIIFPGKEKVIDVEPVVETPNAVVAEEDFPEADPNEIDLGHVEATPDNISVPVEEAPPVITPVEPTETNISKVILSGLTGMMQHLPVDTIEALTKQARVMTKALEEKIEEPDTILGDEEVNEILSYLRTLEDKYFDDIPLTETPSQSYVWNIPYQMYEDMRRCINEDVPDVFNPMFIFYLTMTDYPADAMGRYLRILTDVVYDHNNEMLRMNQEYLQRWEEAEEDADETIHFNEDDND